jgi:hypothetical protein
MKKSIKKLQLNKQVVKILDNNEKRFLNGGGPTLQGNGADSFGTICFVCDTARPLPFPRPR